MEHHFVAGRALALGLAAGLAFGGSAFAQTLRVSNLDPPTNKGDPTVSLGFQHLYAYEALFDAPTTVEGDGKAAPRLATVWTNKDPTTWEFKLRPNVRFHAGTPFNADAIIFAVRNLQSDDQKKFGASVYGGIRHIVEATKVDDLTVLVKTDRPAPILPNEIAAFRIVDPRAWIDLGRDRFGTAPSGTGPFRVTAWPDTTRFEATKFDGGVRVPKVAGLQMYFMPEGPTRLQAFQSGAVEVALGISSDAVNLVQTAGGTISLGPTPSVTVTVFNQSKGGFTTDKRVRQAFNYALDKSFTETLFGGRPKAAGQPAASTVNGYQADIRPYPYDPDRAKKLLADAGYANGLKATAEVIINNADNANLYQKVAQDLLKVGIALELKVITVADNLARLNMTKPFEGEFLGFNFGSAPPIDVMRPINAYYHCNAPQKWTCIPEAEDAIKGANSEFDPAKRAAHLRRLAQLFHEEAPVIYLHEPVELTAVAANVRNFKMENWRINWHDIEMTR